MKGQRAIIRLLDEEDTKQSSKNKKHVQTLKEKATKEAQKRISAARKHPDRVPTNSKAIKGTGNVTSGEKTPLPGVAENINKPRERVNDKNDFKNVESPHVYNYEGRYNLTPTPISIRRFTNNISKINGKLSVKTKSESDLTINNAEYEITIDRPGQRNVINSPTTLVKSYNYKNKTGHSDDEEADSARGSGSRSGGSSVSSRKGPGRYRKRVQTLPYTKRASESALETFLFANGLENCLSALRNEKVDLDALFMLTENDLKELGISMGYRKKLMEALRCHQQVLKEPGGIYDSII